MSLNISKYEKSNFYAEAYTCRAGLGNVRPAGHIRPAKHRNVAHELH